MLIFQIVHLNNRNPLGSFNLTKNYLLQGLFEVLVPDRLSDFGLKHFFE